MKQATLTNISAVVLMIVLFVVSFFKDHFTPDLFNSPPAQFLSSQNLAGASRISTLASHPLFWIQALVYSAVFVFIPYFVFRLLYNRKNAGYIGLFLGLAMAAMYLMVLLHLPSLDRHIVPKLNRYLHSPIITLFLVAAFKLLAPRND